MPSPQGTQTTSASTTNSASPGAHDEHAGKPMPENRPAGQSVQIPRPELGLNVLVGQSSQLVARSTDE